MKFSDLLPPDPRAAQRPAPSFTLTNELGERRFLDEALPGGLTTRRVLSDVTRAARQQGRPEAVVLATWCAQEGVDLQSAVNAWGQTRRLRGDPFPVFYRDLGITNEGAARELWSRAAEIGMRPALAFAMVITWTARIGDADDAVKVVTVYVLVHRCTLTGTPLEPELAAMAQGWGDTTEGLWLLAAMALDLTEPADLVDRLRDHATTSGIQLAALLVMIEDRSQAAKLPPAQYAETLLAEAADHHRRAEMLQNFAASGVRQKEEARKTTAEDLEAAIAELDNMIGLQEAKDAIRRFMAVMEVTRARGGTEVPAMNLVFIGGPGTGKTTLARLLGRLLAGAGLLASGHVVETDPGGMKGAYVGQTAPRVTALFDSARHGILFIDEIYGLADNQDTFGREATDVLLKLAEDRRGQLAVVIAGYSAETQRFLDSNPGLQSRFNTIVRFTDYTPTEMLQVMHLMANKQGYNLAAGCDEILNGYFARRPQGNGRLCRNVLDAAAQEAALRLQPRLNEASKEELAQITPADLMAAISRLASA